MPFSLKSNAKLSDKPHLGKRTRSFGKKNAVFLGKERGLFGEAIAKPRWCEVLQLPR